MNHYIVYYRIPDGSYDPGDGVVTGPSWSDARGKDLVTASSTRKAIAAVRALRPEAKIVTIQTIGEA